MKLKEKVKREEREEGIIPLAAMWCNNEQLRRKLSRNLLVSEGDLKVYFLDLSNEYIKIS